MLLKTLELKDFRQFKGTQKVEFSTEADKNVTIIMGGNGSGKTTLAQAFTWCLYGNTDFNDKEVFCKATGAGLAANSSDYVRVTVCLLHNEREYTIKREQTYKKDVNGIVRPSSQTTLSVSYKDDDGQTVFEKQTDVESRIKEILPVELSHYFFFDGERIDKMSKDITKGKSPDFAEAVRNLLGLSAFSAAMEHLNGKNRKSVIRKYNEEYDSSSDEQLIRISNNIKEMEDEVASIDERIQEIDNERSNARDEIIKLKEQIRANAEGELLEQERTRRLHSISSRNERIKEMKTLLTQKFNMEAPGFLARKLIQDALLALSESGSLDKGIPDIHAKTIEYLIERGHCICGTQINNSNEAYKHLQETLKFIPPQSVGSAINNFTGECESYIGHSEIFFTGFVSQFKQIRTEEKGNIEDEDRIQQINTILQGLKHIGKLQESLMRFEKLDRELGEENDNLLIKKGDVGSKLKRESTSRKDMALRDDNNKRIETYKAYALYMYNTLYDMYEEKENETREKLQRAVNTIFREIYNGGLSLSIDKQYNIQIAVVDYNGYSDKVETSTAQSISVILSFIAGIIKLAKESTQNNDGNDFLTSEPYPLVMDAPLSAFDKTRIKTVCDVLPEIAEQIILFIKDTDGDIARSYMENKIGQRYGLNKHNELESYIVLEGM